MAWGLAIDFDFVVRVCGALDYHGTELHYDHLRGQRTRQPQLENSGIRVGQPVMLDQVLCDHIAGKHRSAAARCPGVGNAHSGINGSSPACVDSVLTRNPPVISAVESTTLNSAFISRSIRSSNTGLSRLPWDEPRTKCSPSSVRSPP